MKNVFKGKAPIVPFHGIPSPYSYFEEIRLFVPIQQGTEKTEKKSFALDQLYIELKTKSLFTTANNVFPFKFKC